MLIADIKAYEHFLHDTIFKLPGITHVRSSIVLKEVKQEVRLPVAITNPPIRRLRRKK